MNAGEVHECVIAQRRNVDPYGIKDDWFDWHPLCLNTGELGYVVFGGSVDRYCFPRWACNADHVLI